MSTTSTDLSETFLEPRLRRSEEGEKCLDLTITKIVVALVVFYLLTLFALVLLSIAYFRGGSAVLSEMSETPEQTYLECQAECLGVSSSSRRSPAVCSTVPLLLSIFIPLMMYTHNKAREDLQKMCSDECGDDASSWNIVCTVAAGYERSEKDVLWEYSADCFDKLDEEIIEVDGLQPLPIEMGEEKSKEHLRVIASGACYAAWRKYNPEPDTYIKNFEAHKINHMPSSI